jgi:uncharacterized protein (DUF2336 family)
LATREDIASREDLLRVADGPSWTVRAKSAERIAALYCCGSLDLATRRVAEDSFRVLRHDGEALVRRLLAECLKQAAGLPRDIAYALATDKAEIAAPFLARSPTLTDRDLLAILRDHPGPHRLAIAHREGLSGQLSDALCRCGEDDVTLAVLANESATIDDATLHWLLDRQPSRTRMHEAVARRKLLPIGIAEHLRGAAIERPRPTGEARAAASCERAAV